MLYPLVRMLLFRFPPEQVHAWTLSLIRLAGTLPPTRALLRALFVPAPHPVQAFGLRFNNPVGLAAGYDKDGLGWRGLAALGFGHIEVGTVTPRPQPGNPAPRLFRLPENQAIINRMGFPGQGAAFVERQLAGRRPTGLVVGVNLGKNKDTPLEHATEDYLSLLRQFAPLADYLAVNVSSPNTVGLRRLQGRQALDALLNALDAERLNMKRRVPLLVKLAPDLSNEELDDALDVIQANRMDGVIATNTTLSREGILSPVARETGGLSGAPLAKRSTEVIRYICRTTQGCLPVIGVGGIFSAQDAQEKLEAGAILVQVYTGLIYRGPVLVKEIVRGL